MIRPVLAVAMALIAAACSFLDASWYQVTVFVDESISQSAEAVEDLHDLIDGWQRTTLIEYRDEDAAYEAGLEMFADDPDMLEAIKPGLLPASFQALVGGRSNVEALAGELEVTPGVIRVEVVQLEVEPEGGG